MGHSNNAWKSKGKGEFKAVSPYNTRRHEEKGWSKIGPKSVMYYMNCPIPVDHFHQSGLMQPLMKLPEISKHLKI
jgi:hypothetical protein